MYEQLCLGNFRLLQIFVGYLKAAFYLLVKDIVVWLESSEFLQQRIVGQGHQLIYACVTSLATSAFD